MRRHGFTLIEIVIVIIILGIVAVIGNTLLHKAFSAAYTSRNLTKITWQSQLALRNMANELAEIRSATTQDLTLGANSITFTDINGNTIGYTQIAATTPNCPSGNCLIRTTSSATTPMADSVTSLNFTYYDQNNQQILNLSNVSAVRCINVAITLNKAGSSANLQTTICPRNLLW